MEKGIIGKEIFVRDIDEESKLYKVINEFGDVFYVIKELYGGEYLEIFSTHEGPGEPERMVSVFKVIKANFEVGEWK